MQWQLYSQANFCFQPKKSELMSDIHCSTEVCPDNKQPMPSVIEINEAHHIFLFPKFSGSH